MNATKNLRKTSRGILVILMAVGLVAVALSTPVAAEPDCADEDDDTICLCDDASETADTVKNVFLIMQILGPIFGTLFFVGLSVAGAASIKDKYGEQRRKVLLLGFGVPVAVVFLEAIANNVLIDQDIGCFFPGSDGG